MLPICPVCTTLGPSLADRIRCPIVQSYQQEEHRRKLDVILFINTQMEWNQGGKGTGIGIQLYSDFLRIGQVRFLFKKIRDEPTLREFDSSARGRQQRRRLLRRDRTSASAMNCADRSPPSWEASATARWSTPSRQHRKTRLWYAYSISLLLSPLTIRSCPYYFNPYMLK